MGCHASEESANQQLKALYANENSAKSDQIERRFFNLTEIRAVYEGEHPPVITGHAAVFNQPSQEIFWIPGWREVIHPGAFRNAIGRDDVRALINHDNNLLIGRVSNSTLSLEEDDIGLKVRISPPDTTYASDLLKLIRGKYMTQMSFGFTVADDGERINHKEKLREIVEVSRLFDVSPVTEPAYTQTDVSVRSRLLEKIGEKESKKAPDELEKAEFRRRMKEREEFIARRSFTNPLDLKEILRNARIKL
jgi:HK97 family phage prohead protease